MNSFLAGALFFAVMYVLRFALVFFLTRYYKEDLRSNFDFNSRQIIFETLLFGSIFSLFSHSSNSLVANRVVSDLFNIFIISIIPTYVYVLQPFIHLFDKSESATTGTCIDDSGLINYRIKVVDKNLINAYATGIIPFSKTILIGKPLLMQLKDAELLSIKLHEAGHLKYNHLSKLYLANLLLSILFYFILQIRSSYFDFNNNSADLLSVGLLGCLYGFLVWYVPGKIQYRFELEADRFSALTNGKENLINALLALDRLSNGEVSKGGVTHPKLSVRIENIKSL
jgi:Zn-dependent protease with chaperone function